MVALLDLWMPILVSAVFVFLVSSVLHMVVPIHKSDYKPLPGEDEVLAALRGQGVSPGEYMFPCPTSMKEMASPEMVAKFNQGPVGIMTVKPNGPMTMGKSLAQWFLYSILISVFAAYIASMSMPAGASSMLVFRSTAAVATIAYAGAYVPDSIWKGLSWTTTLKFAFDGILYAVTTGATFAWLWPSVA